LTSQLYSGLQFLVLHTYFDKENTDVANFNDVTFIYVRQH